MIAEMGEKTSLILDRTGERELKKEVRGRAKREGQPQKRTAGRVRAGSKWWGRKCQVENFDLRGKRS